MTDTKPATDPAVELASKIDFCQPDEYEIADMIRATYAPILAAADSMMEAIGNYFECSAPECEPACSECSTWLKESADQYRKLTPKD